MELVIPKHLFFILISVSQLWCHMSHTNLVTSVHNCGFLTDTPVAIVCLNSRYFVIQILPLRSWAHTRTRVKASLETRVRGTVVQNSHYIKTARWWKWQISTNLQFKHNFCQNNWATSWISTHLVLFTWAVTTGAVIMYINLFHNQQQFHPPGKYENCQNIDSFCCD